MKRQHTDKVTGLEERVGFLLWRALVRRLVIALGWQRSAGLALGGCGFDLLWSDVDDLLVLTGLKRHRNSTFSQLVVDLGCLSLSLSIRGGSFSLSSACWLLGRLLTFK